MIELFQPANSIRRSPAALTRLTPPMRAATGKARQAHRQAGSQRRHATQIEICACQQKNMLKHVPRGRHHASA